MYTHTCMHVHAHTHTHTHTHTHACTHTHTHTHTATLLGPYFGKAVHKDQVEDRDHNEWLWEVSHHH